MAQPGNPDPQWAGASVLQELLQHLAQMFEFFLVAEKAGDRNQQILEKGIHRLWVCPAELGVVLLAFDPKRQHAPFDATVDGGLLVVAKVDAGAGQQDLQQVSQRPVIVRSFRTEFGKIPWAGQNFGNIAANLAWPQNQIHAPALDGSDRHAVVFRAFCLLGNGNATGFPDRLDPVGAIAAGSRQDHPGRTRAAIFGKRDEKTVDRGAGGSRL